jgi:pimeloyl-ACP methyl ester carboxylesterase
MPLLKKVNLPRRIGKNEPIESCVIFVHGLAGNLKTWEVFANHLAGQWIYDESFGLEYDLYTIDSSLPVVGFFKRLLMGGPAIEILADSLYTTINEVCKEYTNVIIVAHSMGGLIARQYLVNLVKRTKEVGKIKGLITYATPHKGSNIASWYKLLGLHYFDFPFGFASQQIVQMCRHESSFISVLNREWDTLGIEQKIDFRRVVGERDFVVDRESASLGIKLYDSISNKGHFSIIKPLYDKDPAFLITFNYLKDFKKNLEKKIENEELDLLTQEEDDYDPE